MKTKIETITPFLAKEILEKNTGNRKISIDTVRHYKYQMDSGQWKLSPQGIAIDWNGNLIDGQHRLTALVQHGMPLDFVVSRGCDPDVFKNLDTGKKRGARDVFYIEGIKNYTNVSSGVKKFLMLKKQIIQLTRGVVGVNITNEDILNEYNLRPEKFQSCHLISDSFYKKLRIISKSDTFGYVAFLNIVKGYSFEFIDGFFNELSSYSKNNTLNLFRKRMMKNQMTGKKDKPSTRNALFIKTWNCYVSGRSLKKLSFSPDNDEYPKFK